jgi:hypothetical protein
MLGEPFLTIQTVKEQAREAIDSAACVKPEQWRCVNRILNNKHINAVYLRLFLLNILA